MLRRRYCRGRSETRGSAAQTVAHRARCADGDRLRPAAQLASDPRVPDRSERTSVERTRTSGQGTWYGVHERGNVSAASPSGPRRTARHCTRAGGQGAHLPELRPDPLLPVMSADWARINEDGLPNQCAVTSARGTGSLAREEWPWAGRALRRSLRQDQLLGDALVARLQLGDVDASTHSVAVSVTPVPVAGVHPACNCFVS